MKKMILTTLGMMMALVISFAAQGSNTGGVAAPIFYSVNAYRTVLDHGSFNAFSSIQKMTAKGSAVEVVLDNGCVQHYQTGISSMDPVGGNEVFYTELVSTENCD